MEPVLAVVTAPAADIASRAAGGTLALAALGVAALRRFDAKPLHPRGSVVDGTLTREGVAPGGRSSGLAWVDRPGVDRVLVRRSRAVGLPESLPDVHGVALRVAGGEGDGDILLASTGWRGLGRFVLSVSRSPTSRPLTTLLPYRTRTGPVLLGARYVDDGSRLRLSWARPFGPWQAFGEVALARSPRGDADVRFDPVLRHTPGLETYGWVRRLREPAYAVARAVVRRGLDTPLA